MRYWHCVPYHFLSPIGCAYSYNNCLHNIIQNVDSATWSMFIILQIVNILDDKYDNNTFHNTYYCYFTLKFVSNLIFTIHPTPLVETAFPMSNILDVCEINYFYNKLHWDGYFDIEQCDLDFRYERLFAYQFHYILNLFINLVVLLYHNKYDRDFWIFY